MSLNGQVHTYVYSIEHALERSHLIVATGKSTEGHFARKDLSGGAKICFA